MRFPQNKHYIRLILELIIWLLIKVIIWLSMRSPYVSVCEFKIEKEFTFFLDGGIPISNLLDEN